MTDRLTLEAGLMPELERTLAQAAGTAGSHSGSVSRLASWASSTHPSLAPAAATLRQAQRALSDTSTRLTDVRTQVGQRANLLELEAWPTALPGAWGKRNQIVGRTPEEANARADGQQDDLLTDLWQMPWFAYWGVRDSAVQGGYGMLHADLGEPGDSEVRPGSSIDLFSQQSKAGLVDPDTSRWGAAGDAQVFGLNWVMGHNSANVTDIEGSALSAEADASVGKDGASGGAQASLGDVAVTQGRLSNKRADDLQERFGVSAGVGGAGRLHWSDEDRDGVREYGFGFDAGPISLDFKSEKLDPVVEATKRLLR